MSQSEGLSYWLDSFKVAKRPALAQDLRVDVCVVGAGIAGMTTGYLLAKEGRRVAIQSRLPKREMAVAPRMTQM